MAFTEELLSKRKAGEISEAEFFRICQGDHDLLTAPPSNSQQVKKKMFAPDQAHEQMDDPNSSKNMKTNFLQEFDRLTSKTKDAFGGIEMARRGGHAGETVIAVRRATAALRVERKASHDPVEAFLQDNPEMNEFWDVVPRYAAGVRGNHDRAREILKSLGMDFAVVKNFGLDTVLANAPWPIPVSPDLHSLLKIYGAYSDLGVVVMPGTKSKFPKLTGLPDAIFITPGAADRTITADVSLAGSNVQEEANTVGSLINASNEVLEDGKQVISAAILTAFLQGLAKRLDYACFQGNGTDDTTNGTQTGIFNDGDISNVNAAATHTDASKLIRDDFILAVAELPAGALQRPCRWYISPAFLAALLKLKDGDGPQYLLKTPAETQGEWHLCGFPVTWAAQAPGTDGAAKQIAAFGEPRSYLVALREQFEMMSSLTGVEFKSNMRQIRALMRGRVETRDADGFAVLKTAAA